MSSAPRQRSTNATNPDPDPVPVPTRPVLVPAGNNKELTRTSPLEPRKQPPPQKQLLTTRLSSDDDEDRSSPNRAMNRGLSPPLSSQQRLVRSNLSMNASCSSDASTESSRSRGSSGRRVGGKSGGLVRRKVVVGVVKMEKLDSGKDDDVCGNGVGVVDDGDGWAKETMDGVLLGVKKRCAWVTPSTDSCYAAFHDEEWGVSVHEDNKLFELLSLSGALAELPWPSLLSKRIIFREVFLDFDPIAVSKLNEKKIVPPGSPGHSLLSELKLRAIIENARQICKIINEFGSFDKYIWGFVNQKPLVSKFRYPRQVPVKTPKADVISKDLVRRGFRSVSPTVVYSFMQVAGLTNDHLISCFRFQECMAAANHTDKDDGLKAYDDDQDREFIVNVDVARALDEMSICSDI